MDTDLKCKRPCGTLISKVSVIQCGFQMRWLSTKSRQVVIVTCCGEQRECSTSIILDKNDIFNFANLTVQFLSPTSAYIFGIVVINIPSNSSQRHISTFFHARFLLCPLLTVPCHWTDGGEIWHAGGDRDRSPPPCQISPPTVQRQGYRTPKTETFLLRFDQNVEYKRPAGAYPLRDFHKNLQSFYPISAVKIWLDLLEGLWSHGGFKLRSGFPQIFSAP